MDHNDHKPHRLNRLLAVSWRHNRFYRRLWRGAGLRPGRLESPEALGAYPRIDRFDLLADQASSPPAGTNLARPLARCRHVHCSSGTSGAALLWADDDRGWRWLVGGSAEAWRIAGLHPGDRVLMLGRFGASLGPWLVREGAVWAGATVLCLADDDPERAASCARRLRPNVLAGPPRGLLDMTHALDRLSHRTSIRLIVALGYGHSAGAAAALAERWAAPCLGRYGMTEAGAIAAACPRRPHAMHLLDERFVVEVIGAGPTGSAPGDGEGELVLTTLGRSASPIIRYRTGDVVTVVQDGACPCGRSSTVLLGTVRRAVGAAAAAGPGASAGGSAGGENQDNKIYRVRTR